MSNNFATCSLALSLLASLVSCAQTVELEDNLVEQDQPLIFGTDDRLEYGQASFAFQSWADSTAMAVFQGMVNCTNNTCSLTSRSWTTDSATGEALCSNVRYYGQSTLDFGLSNNFGGYCTVFLVAPNMVVSAGHCFDGSVVTPGINNTKFVFGYKADASGGSIPTSVPQSEVYSASTTIPVQFGPPGEDWALVTLDRQVSNHPPLYVRHSAAVATNTPLAIIGHPNGLPMKISPTGQAADTSGTVQFGHNVESFAVNSGSPVFDRISGLIEGIHIQPPKVQSTGKFVPHFVQNTQNTCLTEFICADTGCPGAGYSQATRITRLSDKIPLTPVLIVVANDM
jgi:V8-like Glu-specific endopeptidase